jgi:hypothetical protein
MYQNTKGFVVLESPIEGTIKVQKQNIEITSFRNGKGGTGELLPPNEVSQLELLYRDINILREEIKELRAYKSDIEERKERVLRYFKQGIQGFELDEAVNRGICTTLKTLGIKIKGINE